MKIRKKCMFSFQKNRCRRGLNYIFLREIKHETLNFQIFTNLFYFTTNKDTHTMFQKACNKVSEEKQY